MPITSVINDPDNLKLTVVGEFPVSRSRLWQAWADPRQLERFWGPPTWPATFTRLEMFPGGRADYFMTGPDGTRACGYWEFTDIKPGYSFDVVNGFAHDDGTPNDALPSHRLTVSFDDAGTGSRFIAVNTFPSLDALETMMSMGMDEGMTAALNQADAVLVDLASFASNLAAHAQLLTDTQVRVSRVIRGAIEEVWRAHNDAELMRRWMLGPDGWHMTVCQVAEEAGQSYRYEWEPDDGSPGFGFTGRLISSQTPVWQVTTEAMIGMEHIESRNEMTLSPVDDGTLLTLVITYPSAQVRDSVLATGSTLR